MAIEEGAIFSVKPREEDMTNKKPRRKKGDPRPFAPAELNVKPSRYNVAERLYEHFTRARNDAVYGLEWTPTRTKRAPAAD